MQLFQVKNDVYQVFCLFRNDEHSDSDRDEDDAEDDEVGKDVPGRQDRVHGLQLLLHESAIWNFINIFFFLPPGPIDW